MTKQQTTYQPCADPGHLHDLAYAVSIPEVPADMMRLVRETVEEELEAAVARINEALAGMTQPWVYKNWTGQAWLDIRHDGTHECDA